MHGRVGTLKTISSAWRCSMQLKQHELCRLLIEKQLLLVSVADPCCCLQPLGQVLLLLFSFAAYFGHSPVKARVRPANYVGAVAVTCQLLCTFEVKMPWGAKTWFIDKFQRCWNKLKCQDYRGELQEMTELVYGLYDLKKDMIPVIPLVVSHGIWTSGAWHVSKGCTPD